MQGAVVMLIAVSGLGCQNKDCNAFPTPQMMQQSTAESYATPDLARGYPSRPVGQGVCVDSAGYPADGGWRGTFWSFIIGHDPDVPTVRDIEASLRTSQSH